MFFFNNPIPISMKHSFLFLKVQHFLTCLFTHIFAIWLIKKFQTLWVSLHFFRYLLSAISTFKLFYTGCVIPHKIHSIHSIKNPLGGSRSAMDLAGRVQLAPSFSIVRWGRGECQLGGPKQFSLWGTHTFFFLSKFLICPHFLSFFTHQY